MEELRKKRDFFQIEIVKGEIINFERLFGNSHPVHLEIGSGRGEFLIQKAEQNPQVNFFALELKEKRIKTILRKLDPQIHENVRLSRVLVDASITEYLEENSLEMIYIIHPDPWPKRKHFKNRIIQKEFITHLKKILKPKGEIFISTDHKEYAFWIMKQFNERNDFKSFYENGCTHISPKGHIETHFEKIKKQEGYKPFYMRFIKITN
jgi:tRNA (guanine-N7-)-methyltransferase